MKSGRQRERKKEKERKKGRHHLQAKSAFQGILQGRKDPWK